MDSERSLPWGTTKLAVDLVGGTSSRGFVESAGNIVIKLCAGDGGALPAELEIQTHGILV